MFLPMPRSKFPLGDNKVEIELNWIESCGRELTWALGLSIVYTYLQPVFHLCTIWPALNYNKGHYKLNLRDCAAFGSFHTPLD